MFSNKTSDVIGFHSEITEAKSSESKNVQTISIVYNEGQSQAAEKKTVETQTLPEHKAKATVSYQQLAEFLRKVTPDIIKALDETYGADTFEEYDPYGGEDSVKSIELLNKFNTLEELDPQLKVSDLTWSTGGGTIAISQSVKYHETWCEHRNKIFLYNLTKQETVLETPNKKLETNSCVTKIVYHPLVPSILAAGLFNGDILLWNLRDEISITPLVVCTHEDSVSNLQWRSRKINDISILISCSKDGYIFTHKVAANFTMTKLHKKFKLSKEHNPVENSRPRSAGGRRERAAEGGLCITSFDFSSKRPLIFIVGTLCGGLYKCSLDRNTPIEDNENILDPVIAEYERQDGSITCVKCTPTHDLFLVSSTDKKIRIFNMEEHGHQQSISTENTVIGLSFMIGNQDIFAAYGAGAIVKFYNVIDGKVVTNVKMETVNRDNISCLCINFKRDLLAVGDTAGNLEIWKVSRDTF
ncbi:cytoplasmic dynein 2 intermediate chain 2-like [Prorops nasuta]|uniref:cytoplasmic dynein 2 intermediate chain 2-like n=1 Tax=Prorops nasuta TaxID=863751 RepID=UPI0034CE5874